MPKDSQYQYLSSHLSSYLGPISNLQVEVNGQQWRYLEGGQGEVVIFLHGLCGSKTQWRSLMRKLIAGYRVIAIDLPGFYLEQGLDNKKHNLRELALWLDAFTMQLGIEKCHVIAHSMGCPVGAYYAATRTEMVSSLSLLSFPDVLLPGESGKIELWDRFKETISFESVEEIDDYFQDIYYKLPAVPAVIKKYSYRSFKKHQERYICVLDELAATMPLILTYLGKIQCPVLSVDGEHDGWSSEALKAEIDTHMPHAKHVQLRNCGHMCFFERPMAVQKICTDFLTESSLATGVQQRNQA